MYLLRKVITNPTLVTYFDSVGVKDSLSYEEVLVKIIDRLFSEGVMEDSIY